MSARLHSLAFSLRHREDIEALCESGRRTPKGIKTVDWSALWDVVDRGAAQAQECLTAVLEGVEAELSSASLRLERVTQQRTLAQKWELSGRVFARRSRTSLGFLGASLGVDARQPTSLALWWGFERSRRTRGPRLAEILRAGGCSARVGAEQLGWYAGTVVISEFDLVQPRTVQECVEHAVEAARAIAAHRDALLQT